MRDSCIHPCKGNGSGDIQLCFFGSKQECLAWLKEESHVEELMEIYNHLVEKADDML